MSFLSPFPSLSLCLARARARVRQLFLSLPTRRSSRSQRRAISRAEVRRERDKPRESIGIAETDNNGASPLLTRALGSARRDLVREYARS